jgi:hypothetical protein
MSDPYELYELSPGAKAPQRIANPDKQGFCAALAPYFHSCREKIIRSHLPDYRTPIPSKPPPERQGSRGDDDGLPR